MSPTTRKKKISTTTTPVARKLAPRVIKSVEVKPEKVMVSIPTPALNLYRRIVGGFIALVVLVLGSVVLLSTTKATIEVTPKVKTLELSFLTDVVKEGAQAGEINGTVVEKVFEQSQEFSVANGEQKEVLNKAGGIVKIINNSSKTQPLVATTRLLSSGGVLFRLDKGVTVPAGGSVETVVYADQVGSTGDIGPDKFTIPGLSTSLQTSIFGESSLAMSGGRKMVSVVTQEEIDADSGELTIAMFEAGKEELKKTSKGNWTGEAFYLVEVEKSCDTKAGEEKDKIVVSSKIKITTVFFDVVALNKLIEAKLYENLDDGFVFAASDDVVYEAQLNPLDATIEIAQSDVSKATAEFKVTVKRNSIVSNTSSFLQPEVLVGKTPDEVKNYLVTAGVASDVQVKIFPPWAKKIPSMVDHVSAVVLE